MTLKQEILERLPDMPHWRWVLWHLLEHNTHPDADTRCRELARWAKDRWDDWEEMLWELGLARMEKWANGKAGAVTQALALWKDPLLKTHVERSLAANLRWVDMADPLEQKTGHKISADTYEAYKEIFFDLESVTLTRTLRWMERRGLPWTELWCPLPNEFRGEWAKFKLGARCSPDGNMIINQLLMQAFLASESLCKTGNLRDPSLITWQTQVLNILRTAKDLGYTTGGKGKLPDHLIVQMPDSPPPVTRVDGGIKVERREH